MASLKHTVSNLQQKNSMSHVFFLVVLLVLVFAGAIALRYYAIEPIKMVNASMAPRHKENSWLWVCKLPQCIDQVKKDETVWAELRNQETLVRRIIAMPGDTLSSASLNSGFSSMRVTDCIKCPPSRKRK